MVWGWVGLVLAVAMGCSPTHNWRQVRPEGAPLVALMPCKPERAERRVPLLGLDQPEVRLQMMSCEVQGRTYAVAAVPLPAGLSPEMAHRAWLRATWASLKQPVAGVDQVPAGWAAVTAMPPATWPGLVRHWRGPGVDHRGRPLQVDVAWWAAPGWLAQAAVYAAQPDAETVQTLFESVRLSP